MTVNSNAETRTARDHYRGAPPALTHDSSWEDLARALKDLQQPGKPIRAEWYANEGSEDFGIWLLLPDGPDTEGARADFSLIAASLIAKLGLSPIPLPEPLQYDPQWRLYCAGEEKAAQLEGKTRDLRDAVPFGLGEIDRDAIDPCTRAWLELLRRESRSFHGSTTGWRVIGGTRYNCSHGTIRDVCAVSAVYCTRRARDEIGRRLVRRSSKDEVDFAGGRPKAPESGGLQHAQPDLPVSLPEDAHALEDQRAGDPNQPAFSSRGVVEGTTFQLRPARSEIDRFAIQAFAATRDLILRECAEQQNKAITQVQQTGNSGGYLPTLVTWGAERVRRMVAALTDAYVEAFTLHNLPADARVERDIKAAAWQMAGGTTSAIRGVLDLMNLRTRTSHSHSGAHVNREIHAAMQSAVNEAALTLARQRITSQKLQNQTASEFESRALPVAQDPEIQLSRDDTSTPPKASQVAPGGDRISVGTIMRRSGQPATAEWSAILEGAFSSHQSWHAHPGAQKLDAILRMAGRMEASDAAGFMALLPTLLQALGLKIPPGALQPIKRKGSVKRKGPAPQLGRGNWALLRAPDGKLKRSVTFDVASHFGGVTKRAIEKAVKKGSLEAEGKRPNRRILVESLLKYFPPETNAN